MATVTISGLSIQVGVFMLLFIQHITGHLIIRAAPQTQSTAQRCKQSDQHQLGMWGDADPNVYYICDPETKLPRQLRCPEGRGFFNGLGYYGCIPFESWPACKPHVALQQQQPQQGDSAQKVACDSEHLLEPWPTSDPNKFSMCVDTTHEPVIVNCEMGKGFVSVASGGNDNAPKIVGCAAWAKWRVYMQCEEYS